MEISSLVVEGKSRSLGCHSLLSSGAPLCLSLPGVMSLSDNPSWDPQTYVTSLGGQLLGMNPDPKLPVAKSFSTGRSPRSQPWDSKKSLGRNTKKPHFTCWLKIALVVIKRLVERPYFSLSFIFAVAIFGGFTPF